jgi:PAS domain S-box-containing protein
MQHSRSGIHQTSARDDELRDERLPLTGSPGDPKDNEIPSRLVMETIPGFVWSALPDGDVEFCNQRWLDYTGMSFNEIKGWGWAAAIHPHDITNLRERWREALMQSTSFVAEARMRRSDGSYRWFLIQALPLRRTDGGIIRWYGTNTDIEDLKRAEEEVQKQSSRWEELFEQAPEAIAVLSTDDRIVRVNKEFTRMFGYESDELPNCPIIDLIVPDALLESAREYKRQLMDGIRVEVETVRRRKDGSQVHVSLLAVPVTKASGEHFANYAIYRDITERKYAEERLRESEARFQAMADTAPVLIWMTGTDGLCNYFNKPWLEFTGRTTEQEVGLGWTQGVHPDDVQGCFDGFLPAFQARKPFRMEYRLRRADGEYRWLIESGIPRYTPGGEFEGYIGSNIDITERKRAEEERERLRQVLADLAHTNRVTTMGELTASFAHEIKQPIAAAVTDARTCLRWLARDPPDMEEAREAASRIIKDVTVASEITSRIHSLFKKEELQRELVDMNEIIREMIALLRGEAGRYSISIHTELTTDLPNIRGDRVQLQQVFMNLMINAIDAMHEMNAARDLTIKSQRNPEDQLLVSVSDNGVGLPPQHADKIFDAFFTTKSQGTGMGLPISRSIIESHGGSLWASRNSERGTTFQFTLPSAVEGGLKASAGAHRRAISGG